ncbi:Uncharacterised protein [Segatella copri]|nr:Uncharacterised protein [Segatella copri]
MTVTLLTGIANHVKSDTCNHANKVVSFERYDHICIFIELLIINS